MTINWNIEVFGAPDSTQDLARERAEEGAFEGLVIQGLTQTKGRGRHGREWHSPMGNLYLSVLLRPNCSPEQVGQLTFVASLALSCALDKYLDKGRAIKKLKWPNDILVNGLKISGILLESNLKKDFKVDFVIIGTGVNILSAPEDAIALDIIKTKPVYINMFRDEYLGELERLYKLWKKEDFSPIKEAWLNQSHIEGEELVVHQVDKLECGFFHGINDNGALLLDQNGKIITIQAGDVVIGKK